MFPLTLIIGIFIWNNRIESYRIGRFNYTVATADNRSGGFPKFPQSFLSGNNENKFFHQFYFPPNNHEMISTKQNTCGTRSVHFTPKRSGKIIGGNCQNAELIVFESEMLDHSLMICRSIGTIRSISMAG